MLQEKTITTIIVLMFFIAWIALVLFTVANLCGTNELILQVLNK